VEKPWSRISQAWAPLKVPKCEIFDRLDFHDFYTIKSLQEDDFGVKESKPVFVKKDLDQTNEQQRHFIEQPISEFHEKVDSIQTSLKQLFTLQQ
jgi:hypothetical protein